ncbi:hypothetical protein NDU88_005688 [Pleurodeles waltl]|uniref:Uncharacterized protein n=1 Tax=Pleurodeles waltl TaxID=8319 RepID=A0AAV7NN44_PLEWA|nr:hypothetical protein NDU88_005688 [Pleurodeles waltl]
MLVGSVLPLRQQSVGREGGSRRRPGRLPASVATDELLSRRSLHLGFRESFLPLHDSRRAEPVETQLLPGPRRPFKLRRRSLCTCARRRLRRVGPQLRTWNTYVSTAAATYAIFNAL